MTFCEVLKLHMESGAIKPFFRESESAIHYDFDGGEGPRFWAMNHQTDELTEWNFSAAQIFATDWKI